MKIPINLRFVAAAVFSIMYVVSAQCQQHSLSISISAPQSVRTGSAVAVEVTLTNTSNRRILIQERNPATDYDIEVRDERGNAVPETDLLRKAKSSPVIPMNSRNFQVYLSPNESTKETIPLSDFYEISRPGAYTVQLSRAVSSNAKDGAVKSNVITITVTP